MTFVVVDCIHKIYKLVVCIIYNYIYIYIYIYNIYIIIYYMTYSNSA